MDDKSFTIRVPQRWVRIAMIVGVTALVVAPLTAVASHVFNDVPDSHTFHNDITWLADAGVTRGCNPPDNTEFCPDDNVTRGQMAAFMNRFAGYIDAEDGTPGQADNATNADNATTADNAQMLGGSTKAELIPRAAFNSMDDAPDEENLTLSAEITAPAPGVLVLSGGVEAFSGPDMYGCHLEIDDGLVEGTQMWSELGDTIPTNEEDCTTSGAATVSAGTYTVDLEVDSVGAGVQLFNASVTALWVPFDGTGAVPTEASSLGGADNSPEDRDS